MTKIFIAYSRKQELFATRLARSLSDAGADVWIDVDDIPAGMRWHRAIQQGLDQCEIMLVIISPESMKSDHVQNEYFYFIDEKKPIIPVLYETTPVPALLRPLQYVDFERQDYDQAFKQLHTELRRRGLRLKPIAEDNHRADIPRQAPLPLEDSDPRITWFERLYWLVRRNAPRFVVGAVVTIFLAVIAGAIIGEGDIRQNIGNLFGGTAGTPIAQVSTQATDESAAPSDTPSATVTDGPTATPTLSGFQRLQTVQAQQTSAAENQSVIEMTVTEDGIRSANATGTAVHIVATESAARATLLALSATPTPTLALETSDEESNFTDEANALPEGCVEHTLAPGEFPALVAETYGVNFFDLMTVNGLDEESGWALQIGDVLIVPLEGCPLTNTQVEIVDVIGAGDITQEAVVIRNNGNTIDIGGWTLSDDDGNTYVIPSNRRLFSGAIVTIVTRAPGESEEDTPILLYWRRDEAVFGDGDAAGEVIVLSNRDGEAQAYLRLTDGDIMNNDNFQSSPPDTP